MCAANHVQSRHEAIERDIGVIMNHVKTQFVLQRVTQRPFPTVVLGI